MSILTPRTSWQSPTNLPVQHSFGKETRELSMWLLVGLGLYLALALVTYTRQDPGWSYSGPSNAIIQNSGGLVGAWCADVLIYLFGYAAFLFPVALVWRTVLAIYQDGIGTFEGLHILPVRWLGFMITLVSWTMLAELYIRAQIIPVPSGSGGVLGQALAPWLLMTITPLGGVMSLMFLCLLGCTWFFGLSWLTLMDAIGGTILSIVYWLFQPVFWLLSGRRLAVEQAEAPIMDIHMERDGHEDGKLSELVENHAVQPHSGSPVITVDISAEAEQKQLPVSTVQPDGQQLALSVPASSPLDQLGIDAVPDLSTAEQVHAPIAVLSQDRINAL